MKTKPTRALNLIAMLAACCLWANGSARADTIIFDNLGTTSQGFGSVSSTSWEAQRFNTDSINVVLTSVTLTLYSDTGGSGTFFLDLYSDAGGVPGASLANLFTGTDPFPGAGAQSGNIQFSGLSQSVAPNTNYWLVLGLNAGPALDIRWGSTNTATGSGSGFQVTNANSPNSGGGWNVNAASPHQAQIVATVPEPSTAIYLGLAAAALAALRYRLITKAV